MRIAPQSFLAVTLFTIAGLVGWAGCSSSVGPQSSIPPTTTEHAKHHKHRAGTYSNISHIFIIIQENRSLNNLFAAANIRGANTTMIGEEENSSGGEVPVTLHPQPLATAKDIDHCYYDAAVAINASGSSKPMDGFNNELLGGCGVGSQLAGLNPYAYVQQSSAIQPLWDLANEWVLGSNFYPTELGPSFVAHLNLIAGTTEYKLSPTTTAVADYPEGDWGCPNTNKNSVRKLTPAATPGPYNQGPPCYHQFHTIADLLDCLYCKSGADNAVPWRYYAPALGASSGSIWSAFQAIKRVYGGGSGKDWVNDVKSPPGQILKDIPAGNLDNVGVTWVVPEFSWSDHAGQGLTDEGPSWVGDIINEIGARTALWNNSLIVVVWDDWGGWYDPAAPPTLDFRGYGIRTPMLIVSPYASTAQAGNLGHVSQERFEPGSILKFIEQVYFNGETLESLPCSNDYYYYYGCNLGYTDAETSAGTTNSIGDVLNMSQAPRPYVPVTTKYPPSKFEKGGSGYYPSNLPPDSE